MSKVTYQGWPNCIRLANRRIEVLATTDVGPRIIHLAVPGGENLFAVLPEQAGLTGGDEWRIYGGHRLWHAPQARPRSELPDNAPVEATFEGGRLRLIPPAEAATGIQKELSVGLAGDQPHVEVRHTLRNTGVWPVELAPWAISAMNTGGLAIVPHSTRPTPDGVLPNRLLALWPFADGQDPRFRLGSHYTLLRQDPDCQAPFKIGLNATAGWAAYYRRGQLLVKCFQYRTGALYPDEGCSVELFACAWFLELETVAPLTRLEPGQAVEHIEHWFLYDGVPSVASEDDAGRIVRPLAEQALQEVGYQHCDTATGRG